TVASGEPVPGLGVGHGQAPSENRQSLARGGDNEAKLPASWRGRVPRRPSAGADRGPPLGTPPPHRRRRRGATRSQSQGRPWASVAAGSVGVAAVAKSSGRSSGRRDGTGFRSSETTRGFIRVVINRQHKSN